MIAGTSSGLDLSHPVTDGRGGFRPSLRREIMTVMTKSSPELAAVFQRIQDAFERRDPETVRGLLSQSEDTLVVGSAVEEWLKGIEATEVFAAQVSEMPALKVTTHRLDAFDDGNVGWLAADTTTELETGATARLRYSVVFRLEGGVWKVVHWHASVPENSASLGVELTTSLSQLLESMDQQDVESLLRSRFSAGIVTLLFSDIEESTSLAGVLGDASWTDLVHRHFADIKRIALEQDGVVVKTIGDGAMLAFESAHGAVLAAAAIERSVAGYDLSEDMRVRVGVHAGDTLYAEGDYFGQTVNKAARIAAAANGGQVLVSDVVRGLVELERVWVRRPHPDRIEGILRSTHGVRTRAELRKSLNSVESVALSSGACLNT